MVGNAPFVGLVSGGLAVICPLDETLRLLEAGRFVLAVSKRGTVKHDAMQRPVQLDGAMQSSRSMHHEAFGH